MATEKENRSLLSRLIAFICCVSCLKKEDIDDDELVITRVYQSKSLTEFNERKHKNISPEVVASKSETTAADIEKATQKQTKRKRRFWQLRKWGRGTKEEEQNPRQEEIGEIEYDMADGESVPEDDIDDEVPGLVLMDGDAGNIAMDNLVVNFVVIDL